MTPTQPRPAHAGDSGVRWWLETPASSSGAVAVLRLLARDEHTLHAVCVRARLVVPEVGGLRLASLCGVDEGVIARPTTCGLLLMPHGGVGVVRELQAALTRSGIEQGEAIGAAGETLEARDAALRERYPEAESVIEARALHALSTPISPLAVDLLLDQASRHARGEACEDALDAALSRLLSPPLVVALGASNIGKSTLVNALAGRTVSAVADEPGTTRDHVGVLLDVDGLTVRYVDTPGVRADAPPVEREAVHLCWRLIQRADLLLCCVDATSEPVWPERFAQWAGEARTEASAEGHGFSGARLVVALRSDLGPPGMGRAGRVPGAGAGSAGETNPWQQEPAVSVCVPRGEGISELARAIREKLVPQWALRDRRAWRFWATPDVRVLRP